jgi:chromosome segregation ATPase
MAATIEDAKLIADQIFIGDLTPTADHAKCLAEYVRSGNSQELEDELTELRNDVFAADQRADAADGRADEMEKDRDRAVGLLEKANKKIVQQDEEITRLKDKLRHAMTTLRQTAANMADYSEKLNPEAIGP